MSERSHLLVLDLDGTCIVSRECYDEEIKHIKTFGCYQNSRLIRVFGQDFVVTLRPGLHGFLRAAQQQWKLAVWSAGCKAYVIEVIKAAFPEDIVLEFVWTRDDCNDNIYGIVTKPLTRIWKMFPDVYCARNTFIVDDTVTTYSENPENAIEILRFDDENNIKDEALEDVLDVLFIKRNTVELIADDSLTIDD